MSGDGSGNPGPQQHVAPGGDAYAGRDLFVAGRDLHVHQAPPAAAPARVWGGVPARNPAFTGREELLGAVRASLVSGGRTVVQALHGMGGVGKTQIAIEYVHRHADDYEIVWWLNAENGALLGEQFALLGAQLGCAQPGMAPPVVRQAVHSELRRRGPWLLVFDNAEDPGHVVEWLPGGAGHTLITSRTSAWREIAAPVHVGVLSRAESVALLRDWVARLPETDAPLIAEAVGDLPLALAQAAGFMAETGMPAAEYLNLLDERPPELLDQGRPPSYPLPLAAVTRIGYDLLRGQDPAAADLAAICAFLAPYPVPAGWFTAIAARMPAPLRAEAADPLGWRRVLARLGRSGLARVDPDGIVMHRLTQAILRASLPAGQAAAVRGLAEDMIVASTPGDTRLPGNWPAWIRLLPHLLALDPVGSDDTRLRDMVEQAAWYLIRLGEARAARDLADHLHQQWRERLGPGDDHTLSAASCLGQALRDLRLEGQARPLDEDTLGTYRRLHGDDHPGTLAAASNLAVDVRLLGDYRAARELDEDTLARRRRVLGEDHPDTLVSASNLAVDLRVLGDYQAARELDEDTLARRRRVLGEDHPDTLVSASSLAGDMFVLGEQQAALALIEDTLARRRRVLGQDHPDTLHSASDLGVFLSLLGDYEASRELNEDVLARRRRVLGPDHPDTLTCAGELASICFMLGQYQAALELEEDTLARHRRVLGEDHPETLACANNLAASLLAAGEYEAARELDEDTLARRRRVLGEDHPDTRESAEQLAEDLRALGEAEPAD